MDRVKSGYTPKIFGDLFNQREISPCNFSHKKRKDSLESSLDWVLFAAENDFPKILVPRLPQNTSIVNIECARKHKTTVYIVYILYVTSFLDYWYIFILLFWY